MCEGVKMSRQNKEKGIVLDVLSNGIDTNANEINAIGSMLSDFSDFITINENLIFDENQICESEFLNIVEANKKHSYKRAGLYQQSLFGRYLEAKKEKDDGYIHDIFEKAVCLRNNLNEIKKLMEVKAFRKEWRKNFGKITPESILKRTGSMRLINTIKNTVM